MGSVEPGVSISHKSVVFCAVMASQNTSSQQTAPITNSSQDQGTSAAVPAAATAQRAGGSAGHNFKLVERARHVPLRKDKLIALRALQSKTSIEKASSSGGDPIYPLDFKLAYFLQHGNFHSPTLTKSMRASVRKTARSFVWKDGQLYKCLASEALRQVPTSAMLPQVFAWCHDQGHVGQVATYDRVRKTYWWDGIKRDCYAYVKNCVLCQKQHDTSIRTDRDMHPISVEGLLPFQKVAIDLAGPLPKTSSGKRHLLVVICYLTKWMEAFPLEDNKASTCADVFVKEIIARYGCPLEVVSDNGHSFHGKFKACMGKWGIQNLRIAPYHPQTNGLVERSIQTIKSALSRMTGTRPKTWDKMIAWVLFAYRNSVQKSTGFSPHFLLFGRDALMPEQLAQLTGGVQIDENASLQQYLDKLLTVAFDMRDTLEQAQHHVALSQEKQRLDFAVRKRSQTARITQVQSLVPGALLLAKRPNSQVTGLAQSWRGPYSLICFVTAEKKSAILKEQKTGKIVRRAVSQLKPFHQPVIPPLPLSQALLPTPAPLCLPSSQ